MTIKIRALHAMPVNKNKKLVGKHPLMPNYSEGGKLIKERQMNAELLAQSKINVKSRITKYYHQWRRETKRINITDVIEKLDKIKLIIKQEKSNLTK